MARDVRTHSPHPSVYEMGLNHPGKPVLGASCSCGWRHYTAYGDVHGTTAAEADEYLRRRFDDHLTEGT